jgi:tetratricopeptide (TPR) repeat protein
MPPTYRVSKKYQSAVKKAREKLDWTVQELDDRPLQAASLEIVKSLIKETWWDGKSKTWLKNIEKYIRYTDEKSKDTTVDSLSKIEKGERYSSLEKLITDNEILSKGVSPGTWKRFCQANEYITPVAFKAYCKILGFDNWQEIAECNEPSQQTRSSTEITPNPTQSQPQSQLQPSCNICFTIPDYTDFFGRITELEYLENAVQTSRIVWLWGELGIGKTYLASQLAQRLKSTYKVCWIEQEKLALDELLGHLNEFLKSNGEHGFVTTATQDIPIKNKIATLVQVITNSSTGNYAIFIDSFQQASQSEFKIFLERFSSHGGNSRLILLNRSMANSNSSILGHSLLSKFHQFPLKGFQREEVVAYLAQKTQRERELSEPDINLVESKTEGHPLALSLIAFLLDSLSNVSLKKVLAELVKYDAEHGADIKQKLIEEVAQQLSEEEKDAFRRLSVFRTSVTRSSWDYVKISSSVGESLLQRGLLSPDGDKFRMHPLLRKFWYSSLENPTVWHEAAARYYREKETIGESTCFNRHAYLEAHYHYDKSEQVELAMEVANQLVFLLHQRERLPSERLTELKDWIFSLEKDWLANWPWLLLEKGRTLEKKDSIEEAESVFRQAGDIFKQQGHQLGRCVALYHQAKIKSKMKPQDALRLLDEVLDIAKETADIPMRIFTLDKMISCYTDIGNYEGAENLATEAENLARTSNDKLGLALTLYSKGSIQRSQSQFVDAEKSYKDSAEIFEQVGDIYRQSKALCRLGIAQGYLGNYPGAQTNIKRAIELKNNIDDLHGQARDLDSLADVERSIGRYDDAQENYKESLKIKKGDKEKNIPADQPIGLIKTYNNLTRLALLTGKLSDAEKYLSDSEDLIDKKNKQLSGVTGTRLILLGDLQFMRSEYKQALQSYRQAQVYFTEPNKRVPYSYARVLFSMGRLYFTIRNLGLAKQYLEKALDKFQQQDSPYQMSLNMTYLARVKAANGRIEEAEQINQKAITLADKIKANHILMSCKETQAMILEKKILKSYDFNNHLGETDGTKNHLIDSVQQVYDEAIQGFQQQQALFDAVRLQVKKVLWHFSVKMLLQQTIDLDQVLKFFNAEIFTNQYPDKSYILKGLAPELLRAELVGVKYTLKIIHSIHPSLAQKEAQIALNITLPLAKRLGLKEVNYAD